MLYMIRVSKSNLESESSLSSDIFVLVFWCLIIYTVREKGVKDTDGQTT